MIRKYFKKYVHNEDGATIFIMFGIFAGIVLIGFVFFDMTSVFSERRMSQTGSDAAAIAAALEAEKSYKEDLEEDVAEKLEDLFGDLEEHKEDWEEDQEDEDSEDNGDGNDEESNNDDEWEEEFDDWIEDREDDHDHQMPGSIIKYLKGETTDVDINDAIKFLWDTGDLSDMVCETVGDHEDEMREAAQEFADRNGIENDISIVFPVEDEGFTVGVRTKATINDSFFEGVNTDELKVPAHAIANIQEPEGVNIDCD
ncbi:pilus assembly protein TadG-related protein [Virgibacillus doumboii]|uniref:pilus assembly protein TadG-related protein n=1 Tax=Virgibacillus doumboii TaxID=2697503 RepID=UPI001FE52842|nr:pilus assembly protein TadG-related protein [Virgibacillus doumboii]